MGVKEKLGNLYYKYKIQPAIDKNGIEWVRQRLYDNLNPVGYWEPVKRINSALDGSMYSETPEQQLETGRKRDDIFAEYLNIPQSQRHNVSEYIVQNSDYVPTKQANQNSIYKKIPLTDEDRSKLVHDAFNETFDLHRDNPHGFYKRVEKGPLQIGESKVSSALSTLLGPHTVSRGFDNNGDYISYYDYWDIAPISGKGNGDETKGIGKPVEFYDRIYLDDYYDIPEEARGNPFIAPSVVTANEKHENGGVIKAQNGISMYPVYGSQQKAKFAYDAGSRNPEAIGALFNGYKPSQAIGKSYSYMNGENDNFQSYFKTTGNNNLGIEQKLERVNGNETDVTTFLLPNGDTYSENHIDGTSQYNVDYTKRLGMDKLPKPKTLFENGGILKAQEGTNELYPAGIAIPSNETIDFFKDFAQRYKKFNHIDKNQSISSLISKDKAIVLKRGLPTYNTENKQIFIPSDDMGVSTYSHELVHKLNDLVLERTNKERKLLNDAYPLSIAKHVYGRAPEDTRNELIEDERFSTNTELRRKISSDYGNVLGKKLNKVIKSLSTNDIVNYVNNINGYVGESDFLKYPEHIIDGKTLFEHWKEDIGDVPEYYNMPWEELPKSKQDQWQYLYDSREGVAPNYMIFDEDKPKVIKKALIKVAQESKSNDIRSKNFINVSRQGGILKAQGGLRIIKRVLSHIDDVPKSKLTHLERMGTPKGVRNQPLNGHLKGDAAVQMFKEYGTTTIPSNSKIYSQIQQLVPEARERYKLVGRTDITDDEIAGSLYKRAMELSGNSNAAIWETGEPRLLFRGDTRRYNRLMDKWSPEKLAKGKGTMDNSLGNLFLGDISGKGQGIDRYFISGTDFFEPRIQGSATGARGKFGTIFDGGGEGIQGTVIPYIPKDAYELSTYQTASGPYSLYKFPGKYSESGISDLNAFITRTPAMRDATGEISVLADDFIMKTKNYKGPNIDDYDGPTYDGVNSTVRDAMAKHYQSVLDDAQSKGQGLLFSEGLTDEYIKKFGEIHPFRREHERYDYYALPNFNRQNAKHLFGWDLRRPIQWDVDNIYLEEGGKL